MAWYVAMFILIFAGSYLTAAVLMIMSGKPGKAHSGQNSIKFQELAVDFADIPQLKTFKARDGKKLAYRHYPAESRKVMILLHGSGWHSRYLHPLARFISHEGLAEVFTPDLRGHGRSPEKRGDVDYIGQLEDDLADFIALILAEDFGRTLILGGHSSGGGLALRFAGSPYRAMVDAFMLLSPFLKYNAPTMRPNSGGWANPHIRPIIGLTMLNNVGIRWLNYLPVIDFNMPAEVRDGTETLTYSFVTKVSFYMVGVKMPMP